MQLTSLQWVSRLLLRQHLRQLPLQAGPALAVLLTQVTSAATVDHPGLQLTGPAPAVLLTAASSAQTADHPDPSNLVL